MADLYLHLPFARRLRLADGLHPLVAEALARRQSLVALGASLPLLPGVERKGMSFFRRLFSGRGDAARWQKLLAVTSTPRVELVKRFLIGGDTLQGLGTMSRLALGLGVLSHELLEAKVQGLVPANAGEQSAIERAQARLWMQSAIPHNLEQEWKVVGELEDSDLHKRTFEHINGALKAAYGEGPGRDVLQRWARGLVAEVAPAMQNGLPQSFSVPDHLARGPYFENNNFTRKVQEAVANFVLLANRLGERLTQTNELEPLPIVEALCGSTGELLTSDVDAEGLRDRWVDWQVKKRRDTLDRGRNDKPAFIEGLGDVKPVHRSAAFTGMLKLSDIPAGDVPPPLSSEGLPLSSEVPAPPIPDGDLSVVDIQTAAARLPALPWDASGPLPILRTSPQAPALTQEISMAQIEGEMLEFAARAAQHQTPSGQSAADGFSAPALTQEVSHMQIEAQAAAHLGTANAEVKNGDATDDPNAADPPRE